LKIQQSALSKQHFKPDWKPIGTIRKLLRQTLGNFSSVYFLCLQQNSRPGRVWPETQGEKRGSIFTSAPLTDPYLALSTAGMAGAPP
jgi:hypothetical protein